MAEETTEEEEEESSVDEEIDDPNDPWGHIIEIRRFVAKTKKFEVGWSKWPKRTMEPAENVIHDFPDETTKMIWEHCLKNSSLIRWIDKLDVLTEVIEGWDGIEDKAMKDGWPGAGPKKGTSGAGTSEPAVVGNQVGGGAGESPFDSEEVRSPFSPPASVSVNLSFTGILGVDAASDIEDSVATVLPIVLPPIPCQGTHEWDAYIAATYIAVKGKKCDRCKKKFTKETTDGGYRVRYSTPVHHCRDCHMNLCDPCLRQMVQESSPPRLRRPPSRL